MVILSIPDRMAIFLYALVKITVIFVEIFDILYAIFFIIDNGFFESKGVLWVSRNCTCFYTKSRLSLKGGTYESYYKQNLLN